MATVHVENISAQTSEKEIRDFFSFCGKISQLSVTPVEEGTTQSATVTFEKETAAKTALLLDNTQLGSAQVKVSSTKNIDEIAGGKAGEEFAKEDSIEQEDKPRARIIAEYLAHGYVVSDKAIERALDLDRKQGLSSRFTSALTNFDAKFKASERAQTIDSKYKVTEKANAGWRSLNSYFDKAVATPTGQKLRQFYEQGSKQVVDVHNEARHLANLKKSSSSNMDMNMHTIPGTDRTKCDCGANLTICPCAPGKCACNSCAKNPEVSGIHEVAGTEKTSCNCSGSTEACGCAPGKCACGSCPKNSEVSGVESVPGTNKTKCNCGATLSKCGCEAGACACDSCAKNSEVSGFEHISGTNKTKCNCSANSSECPCAAGQCACADCGKN